MGTRSTVKFLEGNEVMLSVYQQYDGYPSGVGKQIVNLLDKYKLINGISYGEAQPIANGIGDLALFYVIENKKQAGNIYATSKDDSQEYNYELYGAWEGKGFDAKPIIERIIVKNNGETIFNGDSEEFKAFCAAG